MMFHSPLLVYLQKSGVLKDQVGQRSQAIAHAGGGSGPCSLLFNMVVVGRANGVVRFSRRGSIGGAHLLQLASSFPFVLLPFFALGPFKITLENGPRCWWLSARLCEHPLRGPRCDRAIFTKPHPFKITPNLMEIKPNGTNRLPSIPFHSRPSLPNYYPPPLI